MKIDFETIIYLLITLVFVIVGALGKKKRPVVHVANEGQADPFISDMEQESELVKDEFNDLFAMIKDKGQELKADAETRYEGSMLEDYMRPMKDRDNREFHRELYSEEGIKEREMMKEEVLDSPSSSLDVPFGYLDSVDAVDVVEGISMIDSSEEIEDMIKLTELGSANEQASTKSPVDDLLRNFTFRAAIVYSEILNPRYF